MLRVPISEEAEYGTVCGTFFVTFLSSFSNVGSPDVQHQRILHMVGHAIKDLTSP